MRLDTREVGAGSPPLIVAEISSNHRQSLDRAMQIVESAAAAGAHAVKLQTSRPDGLTLDVGTPDFVVQDSSSPWFGRRLFELYSEAYTPWEWHEPLMRRARELGLICFSSPFDHDAVDFLEGLHVPAYKIASFELVDLPLIRKVASTGKPLIMSTGMATLAEIEEAVQEARGAGCRDLLLLKCTSTYPASPENSNVLTIPHLRAAFGCDVGLSDHTMGIGAAVAAVAHGAVMIEKHVTLSRADGGLDSAFSLEPHELRALVDESARAWQSLGQVTYGPTEAERPSLAFRRSVYASRDLKAGDLFEAGNVRCVRPSFGLPTRHYVSLLGRRARCDIAMGTPISWNLVE